MQILTFQKQLKNLEHIHYHLVHKQKQADILLHLDFDFETVMVNLLYYLIEQFRAKKSKKICTNKVIFYHFNF